jgi:hypothetical protein
MKSASNVKDIDTIAVVIINVLTGMSRQKELEKAVEKILNIINMNARY